MAKNMVYSMCYSWVLGFYRFLKPIWKIRYETNLTPKNEGILQDYETDRKKNLPRPRGKPEGNKKVSEVDTGQGGKI